MMRFTSGLPETLCGAGSTLAETEYLRSKLPWVMEELSVKRLLDAPCGDFHWMSHVDLGNIEYIGADYSAANLKAARERSDTVELRLLDITRESIPQADAMLCRDFYQHLPNEMVMQALRNFVASDIPWLLLTTHDNEANEDIAKAGMFRRINMNLAPFNFPQASIIIADPPRSGHFIGVWSRADVMQAR